MKHDGLGQDQAVERQRAAQHPALVELVRELARSAARADFDPDKERKGQGDGNR